MNLQQSIGILLIAIVFLASCQGNTKHTETFDKLQRSSVAPDSSFIKNESTQTAVYYFHATRRCATCEAVELTTKEALKEYYGDKITFTSINREENKDHELVKSHKISGQTLLIINKDKVVDLTNEAFMNARTNPEKFKVKLKATIDTL